MWLSKTAAITKKYWKLVMIRSFQIMEFWRFSENGGPEVGGATLWKRGKPSKFHNFKTPYHNEFSIFFGYRNGFRKPHRFSFPLNKKIDIRTDAFFDDFSVIYNRIQLCTWKHVNVLFTKNIKNTKNRKIEKTHAKFFFHRVQQFLSVIYRHFRRFSVEIIETYKKLLVIW